MKYSIYLRAVAAIIFPMHLAAQVELIRVDPPNWWIGLPGDSVQLMIHSQGISDYEPKLKSEWISITQTHRTENPNYLFLDLKWNHEVRPTVVEIVFKSKGAKDLEVLFPLYDRSEDLAAESGYGANDVIYLVNPDRFANGDLSNDSLSGMIEGANRGDPNGRHGGDIKGVVQHLDHVNTFGSALWLTPVLENNQERASYHGYSITDHYRIDPRFGSLTDYLELSDQCHQRSIKLIQDVVLNHIGSGHWWMKDLPQRDWINYGDFEPTNHERSTIHDPYAAEIDSIRFVSGWFVPTMPDLNQRNPLLANYLIQNTIWWIETAKLSGLRVDTYSYSDPDFLNRWSCAVMDAYPNSSIVGEEWSLKPAFVSYWQAGSERNPESCLPSLFDFPTQQALIDALKERESWSDGWVKLYQDLALDAQYPDPSVLVTLLDNHDMDRFFTQVDGDVNLWKMGMTFLFTSRGIPQLYYGSELQLANEIRGNHGNIRKDMPGGWEGDEINAFIKTGLTAQQQEAMDFTAKLVELRRKSLPLIKGSLKHFSPQQGVYVYFRYTESDAVMVILNKNKEQLLLPVDRFSEILNRYDSAASDAMNNDAVDLNHSLVLKGSSANILLLHH